MGGFNIPVRSGPEVGAQVKGGVPIPGTPLGQTAEMAKLFDAHDVITYLGPVAVAQTVQDLGPAGIAAQIFSDGKTGRDVPLPEAFAVNGNVAPRTAGVIGPRPAAGLHHV